MCYSRVSDWKHRLSFVLTQPRYSCNRPRGPKERSQRWHCWRDSLSIGRVRGMCRRSRGGLCSPCLSSSVQQGMACLRTRPGADGSCMDHGRLVVPVATRPHLRLHQPNVLIRVPPLVAEGLGMLNWWSNTQHTKPPSTGWRM